MTNEDMTLLKSAAAGVRSVLGADVGNALINRNGSGSTWNPLEDDGDAFRLMTALRINVMFPDFEACGDAILAKCVGLGDEYLNQPLTDEGYRRVIVLAAAQAAHLTD